MVTVVTPNKRFKKRLLTIAGVAGAPPTRARFREDMSSSFLSGWWSISVNMVGVPISIVQPRFSIDLIEASAENPGAG